MKYLVIANVCLIFFNIYDIQESLADKSKMSQGIAHSHDHHEHSFSYYKAKPKNEVGLEFCKEMHKEQLTCQSTPFPEAADPKDYVHLMRPEHYYIDYFDSQ